MAVLGVEEQLDWNKAGTPLFDHYHYHYDLKTKNNNI